MASSLIPALAVLLLAGGFCGWVYYRREFAVRGRLLLTLARTVAVAAVACVLWNPDVTVGAGSGSVRWTILDVSASMTALDGDGVPVGESARERVSALEAEGVRVLLAGAGTPSAGGTSGGAEESRLAGAVATAAEAGAREVVLVTDRRLADPVATVAVARRLGVGLSVDAGTAEAAPNVGISRFDLPATVDQGRPLEGRIEVEAWDGGDADAASQASPPGPVSVVVSVDGTPHETLQLPLPQDGRASAVAFALGGLPPGPRRVEARLERRDAFPLDDRRVQIVDVGAEEPGVLLASFAPGWEPRFLLPVLAQATGLPVRGWLRTGPDRFQPMTGGPAPPSPSSDAQPVDAAGLARLMGRAEVIVAMGVDGADQEFVARAAADARRLVVFPASGAGAAAGAVAASDPQEGEWYVSGAPPSPISGELGDFAFGRLPPLGGVMPLLDEAGGAALEARRGGAGTPRPVLVLREEGGRRTAVALAGGFWRWAFRDEEPVGRYRRLWAAVAGWMIADERLRGAEGVRPAEAVLPRGASLRWTARGHEGQEVRLTVSDSTDAPVLDSTLAVPPAGAFVTPPLFPGPYRFRAEAADTTAGVFEVDSYSGDMLRRPVASSELAIAPARDRAAEDGRRPLRTLPWPYLVVLAALCCEWTGRRRAGLR